MPHRIAPAEAEPRGIIISAGPSRLQPVRFWAYLWAQDEETDAEHWHQHVPTERAA